MINDDPPAKVLRRRMGKHTWVTTISGRPKPFDPDEVGDRAVRAVRLECLDNAMRTVANATGFIVEDDGRFYVYTCWHVVTGFDDRQSPAIGSELPARRILRVHMLDRVEETVDGEVLEYAGGARYVDLALYRDGVGSNGQPLWEQGEVDIENFSLNSIGIFVPLWHDLVRLQLPTDCTPASVQVIDISEFSDYLVKPGTSVQVIGFPNSYSAYGLAAPMPVTLVRHVAATANAEFFHEALLDGVCAPSMSGGPVFATVDGRVKVIGVYVGSVYTDRVGDREAGLALGRISPFALLQSQSLMPSRQL